MEFLQDMKNGGHSQNPSCAICREEFKEPKMLNCGHSFCCQCLTKVKEVKVSDGRYLECSLCRMKVRLPPSGRVEDFPTNYELMNLTSDQPLGQNRRVIEVPPLKRRRLDTETSENCRCYLHNIPMKFYCKTCIIQVCAECLLDDHKVGHHDIVSAADVAVNLSHQLQRINAELQNYEQEKQSINDKIFEGTEACQKEKRKLKCMIDNIRQAKEQQLQNATHEMQKKRHEIMQNIEQLQRAADEMGYKIREKEQELQQLQRDEHKMCNEIDEKAAACEHSLQKKYSNLIDLQNKIQKQGTALDQRFQQHDLTHAGEVEQVSKHFEQFKSCIHSLKEAALKSNSIGLTIYEAKQEILGITLHEV